MLQLYIKSCKNIFGIPKLLDRGSDFDSNIPCEIPSLHHFELVGDVGAKKHA